jgi:hypothetical protein
MESPRPGRISGVGERVKKACGEGVADGGNQTIVGEGSGGCVLVGKISGAAGMSSAEHDASINSIAEAKVSGRKRACII